MKLHWDLFFAGMGIGAALVLTNGLTHRAVDRWYAQHPVVQQAGAVPPKPAMHWQGDNFYCGDEWKASVILESTTSLKQPTVWVAAFADSHNHQRGFDTREHAVQFAENEAKCQ